MTYALLLTNFDSPSRHFEALSTALRDATLIAECAARAAAFDWLDQRTITTVEGLLEATRRFYTRLLELETAAGEDALVLAMLRTQSRVAADELERAIAKPAVRRCA